MTLKVHLGDGGGKARVARVSPDFGLQVAEIIPPVPAVGSASRQRLFVKFLGTTGGLDEGIPDNNADQGVNGSVTAVEFFIEAEEDFDIRIMSLALIIADTAVIHNNFGNVSALTNGWDLIMTEAGEDTFLINKAKTGGQIIAQAGFGNPYGDGATSFELLNWTGTADAQTVSMPIGRIVPGGIRIGRGTNDRLRAVVSDDLTGLTEMYVRVFGYRHYP